MHRTTALCLAIGLLLPLAAQAQNATIRWSAHAMDGKVQLLLTTPGNKNSQEWSPADLQGLNTRFPDGPLGFRIVRDAGVLVCNGTGRNSRGEGECRFQRDAAYFDALARHGVRLTADYHAWQLAIFNVKLPLLDELRRQQYRTPTIGELIEAGIFGVDADFVGALGAAGVRTQKLGELVQFRVHRITPAYIRDIRAANPRLKLDSDDLVAFGIHKVTPQWIEGWTKLGYDLTAKQLVETRILNVSPDYARAMLNEVRDRPTVEQFTAMRLHGVRPGR